MGRKKQKSEVAKYTLRLPTAGGVSTLTIQVSRGPMRLAELVPLAQQLTDLVVEHAIAAEEREGRSISCGDGCAACCRQLVPVSAPEAFRLAEHVVELDEPERTRLLAQAKATETLLEARGIGPRLEALARGELDASSRSALASDYFAMRMACPMLVEERCGAYADRPLACRDYCVTSPAEWCSKPLNRVRRVPTPPGLSEPLSRVAAKLLGTEPELIPLSLALRWVNANAELGFRTWPGTTLFQAWLTELGVVARAS